MASIKANVPLIWHSLDVHQDYELHCRIIHSIWSIGTRSRRVNKSPLCGGFPTFHEVHVRRFKFDGQLVHYSLDDGTPIAKALLTPPWERKLWFFRHGPVLRVRTKSNDIHWSIHGQRVAEHVRTEPHVYALVKGFVFAKCRNGWFVLFVKADDPLQEKSLHSPKGVYEVTPP